MILVDYREKPGKRDKADLISLINRIGVKAEKADLSYGDACFEGNWKQGLITVGVERKTLHDMLHCIDDARYNGYQRLGLEQMYKVHGLIVEGQWRPHDPHGTLMEGFGTGWGECKYRSQRVMYAKLRRYLFSIQLSGVPVLYSRDLFQTAYDITELYHYFQKPYKAHTSLLEMQKHNLPTLNGRPSVTRQWANALEGVGTNYSEQADRLFKTPINLALSEELEWLSIPGIGKKTAQSILAEIQGTKRRR